MCSSDPPEFKSFTYTNLHYSTQDLPEDQQHENNRLTDENKKPQTDFADQLYIITINPISKMETLTASLSSPDYRLKVS